MMRIAVPLVALMAVACTSGARDVDYPPERGISADIGAAHARGSTGLRPGVTAAGEPLGAIPWQLGERHQ